MSKVKKYFESPIFAIVCTENFFIISGGGGSKKFGLKNSIQVFGKPKYGFQLKDPIFRLDLDEQIIERLRINRNSNILIGNSNDFCVVYQLSKEGVIEELNRFQTDFAKKDPCQNDGFINLEGNTIITGGEDGVCRQWSYQNNQIDLQHEYEDRNGKVTTIDIHQIQPLAMIAYDNKELKFINYYEQEILQVIQLTENKLNLRFLCARGESFLTFWQMMPDSSILPLQTHKAGSFPTSAYCVNQNGSLIGIGGSDGRVRVFNIKTQEFEGDQVLHEMPIKGLDFYHSNYLISGSTDFTYECMFNEKKSGWLPLITLIWIISLIIVFLGQLLIDI